MRFTCTAIDCETHLIPPSGKVRTQPVAPPLVCTTVSASKYIDGSRNELIMWDDPAGDQKICEYVCNSDFVVMHNSTFDVAVLSKAYPFLVPYFKAMLAEGRLLDTRVMFALRYPGYKDRYSLKNLIKELFNHELDKSSGVRTSFRQGQVLSDEQKEYALEDAIWTRRAAGRLQGIPYGGLAPEPPFFVQHKVFAEVPEAPSHPSPDSIFSESSAWLAYNIEAVGLEVDLAKLDELRDAAIETCDNRFRDLRQAGLARATRDRTAHISEDHGLGCTSRKWEYWENLDEMVRLYKGVTQRCAVKWSLNEKELRAAYGRAAEDLQLVPPTSEKTGELSIEYDFWKQHKDRLPEPLQTHLALGKQRKLLSTYFEPMKRAAKDRLVVHPNIGVAFAETGRWTCWRPNLQNQPKSIRHMYRSPIQGHVLVSSDYKSLEMYTACEAMHHLGIQNGPLRQILDAEGDTHINTARMMFGECDGKDDPKRKIAKMCNFALLGGMGYATFLKNARAAGFDWTLAQATEIKDAWFRAFDDCQAFIDMFRIDPWTLRPPSYTKRGWLELSEIPTDPMPSKWELSRALNDGAIYSVRLPDGRVVPNRRFSQAANIFFQGLGADVVSLAFNQACSQGLTVCIVVHDSITISAAPEDAEQAGGILVEQMKDAQERILQCGVKIPLPEYEIGENWS